MPTHRLRRRALLTLVAMATLVAAEAVPALAEPSGPQVTSFTLINADTDRPIAGFDPIPAGATIDLAALPTRKLNIRANTNPSPAGSVQLWLDGKLTRTENAVPYALMIDYHGDFQPWTPAVGNHLVAGLAYSAKSAAGRAGSQAQLAFTVTSGTSAPVPPVAPTPSPTPVAPPAPPTNTPAPTPTASATFVPPRPTATPQATATPRPSPTQPAPTPPPGGPGWRMVVNDQFNSGGVPGHWNIYTGLLSNRTWTERSHVTVSGGALHMLMAYRQNGHHGAGWYSSGLALNQHHTVDARITVRFRVVPNGVQSHRIIPMRWPTNGGPAAGEEDYCESNGYDQCMTFLHYGSNQIFRQHTFDQRQWHTIRTERRGDTVRVYIDNLTTPVWTYNGNATTLPRTPKRVVLQQECQPPRCPGPSSGTEEIQVDWITVEVPS
jgi:hypothetical protein